MHNDIQTYMYMHAQGHAAHTGTYRYVHAQEHAARAYIHARTCPGAYSSHTHMYICAQGCTGQIHARTRTYRSHTHVCVHRDIQHIQVPTAHVGTCTYIMEGGMTLCGPLALGGRPGPPPVTCPQATSLVSPCVPRPVPLPRAGGIWGARSPLPPCPDCSDSDDGCPGRDGGALGWLPKG